MERITGASLPAWRIETQLDLKEATPFGTAAALNALLELIGPQPGNLTAARQVAVADFNRDGFQAAAVTVLGALRTARREPQEKGVERAATLRFDHPYAAIAIAIAGDYDPIDLSGAPTNPRLPLFTAWIDTPVEPDRSNHADT